MPSAAEQKCVRSVAFLPAPDTPDFPSTTRCGSTSPRSTSGARASNAAVAKHPGLATAVEPGDRVAVQLGQPVHPLRPVVGGQVHDRHTRTGQFPTELGGGAMG